MRDPVPMSANATSSKGVFCVCVRRGSLIPTAEKVERPITMRLGNRNTNAVRCTKVFKKKPFKAKEEKRKFGAH